MEANHSQLNKYTRNSANYQVLLRWLQRFAKEAPNAINLRSEGKSPEEHFHQI